MFAIPDHPFAFNIIPAAYRKLFNDPFSVEIYCGVFAQSKNCGGRETAVAR
jgi:hypothetical protein